MRTRTTLFALLVLVGFASMACSSPGDDVTPEPTPTAEVVVPRATWSAEWSVDAEAVGVDGPGYAFPYREVRDDRNGRYLVQSPNHLAIQSPERVVFCAAWLRPEPFCAAVDRTPEAPAVLSLPIQVLREWSPDQVYELASYRDLTLLAERSPDIWSTRRGTTFAGTATECFDVMGETTSAPVGFSVCFTDDDLHLVATVDLQGDGQFEVDLIEYARVVTTDDFLVGAEAFVEERASLFDQLLELYPEIPAARATPTPDVGA